MLRTLLPRRLRPGPGGPRTLLLLGVLGLLALLALALGRLGGEPSAGDGASPPQTPWTPRFQAPDTGRWRPARDAAVGPADELTEAQRREIERLEAIGYLAGSRPAHSRGVTRHDRSRAWPGLNLYTSGHGPEAILMDMEGRVLHRWRYELSRIWPAPEPDHDAGHWWRRAYLYPNGDLLAIFEGLGLIKLDKGSNLLWAQRSGAHHDLEVRPGGEIWVLTREAHLVPWLHPRAPVLEDFLTVLDADGRERRRISLLEALRNSAFSHLLAEAAGGDVFHTNSLEVLDGTLADRLPAFRRGNVLISLRQLDLIAVVDPEHARVVWAHRGDFRHQHDPKVLVNGHLMVFDNLAAAGESKVLEIDPLTLRTVWQYRGGPGSPFFSMTCGTAERLPNGNTLITESDNGRAFEVAPDGEIVWEFYNPQRAGEHDELIATLAEVQRLPADAAKTWLGH